LHLVNEFADVVLSCGIRIGGNGEYIIRKYRIKTYENIM